MPRLRPTRVLAIVGVMLLGFLYWRPIHTYLRTKHELELRHSQIASLRSEQATLERKIAAAGTSAELVREARRIGLVKPGEQLFVVRGISAWRHRNR
jgi:cell division protein FtsB